MFLVTLMTVREKIHEIFGVQEAHELPSKLLQIVKRPNELSVIIDNYKNNFTDLNHDYLRDYFQDAVADRSNFMQDYTPESICEIVAEITGQPETCADLCAGTGSLTIGLWQKSPKTKFYCYEISTASVPFLLFNLALRNISAIVFQGDLLTEEYSHVYQCEKGRISEIDNFKADPVDAVISNPPYSLKWTPKADSRFNDYPLPPKGYADLAFALIGLSMLKGTGKACYIYPHGILFRGGQEEKIRTKLIQDNYLDSIIGLPPALFANTTIPVCLVNFTKDPNRGVLVVDASREFKRQPKQNLMLSEHIETVISAFRMRRNIEKLSYVADLKEIKKNDFNMNISRYVDTFEQIKLPPPTEALRAIIENDKAIKQMKLDLLTDMKSMKANNTETGKEFEEYLKLFEEWTNL